MLHLRYTTAHTARTSLRLGHSTKSREWETPAKNLQSSVAIPSSEIPLFSDLSEFVGSCLELSGVVRNCQEFVGSCLELSGVVGTCCEFVGTCRECHLVKPFWKWA